jgi:hypothetical protein
MRTTTQAHKEYHNNLCTKTANTKRDEKKRPHKMKKFVERNSKKRGRTFLTLKHTRKKNG